MTNVNEQFKKNNIVKDANIKELIEEPKEIKVLTGSMKIRLKKF